MFWFWSTILSISFLKACIMRLVPEPITIPFSDDSYFKKPRKSSLSEISPVCKLESGVPDKA